MHQIISILFFITTLHAQTVILSATQIKDWQIKTQKPPMVTQIPLGEFIGQTITPPEEIQSISLPFEAQTQRVFVMRYQHVHQGDKLAEVTGADWIEAQQRLIEESITLKTLSAHTARQNLLCKEGVISQKVCLENNAKLQSKKVSLEVSKALLSNYGASQTLIDTIIDTLKFKQTLSLYAPYDGVITLSNALPGKTIGPSQSLFVLNQHSTLWIESAIEPRYASHLKEGHMIQMTFAGEIFHAKVLHLSSILDPHTQTQVIRFAIPKQEKFLDGMVSNLTITRQTPALKVSKNAVINYHEKKVVFVQSKEGYETMNVMIMGEDDDHYYIQPIPLLDAPIATSSLAILKNLLGEDDE